MNWQRLNRVWVGATVAALLLGGALLYIALSGGKPAYQPRSLPVRAPSVTPPMSAASATASPGVRIYSRSAPVEIKIPALGVDARVMPVYDPGGTLQTPPLSEQNMTGWWAGLSPSVPQESYSPGQKGPAVIVGHINSAAAGDLVFANLYKLRPGEPVTVILASGQQVKFTMVTSQETLKSAFPTQAVYGPTQDPELRLITCGGTFDPSTGHYRDNLIVYLREVA